MSRFFRVILRGGRFDAEGGGLPASMMPHVAAIEDAIIAVARRLYLEANEDRERVPNGFEASMRIALRVFMPGSADNVFGFGPLEVAAKFHQELLEIRDEAFDAVVLGLDALRTDELIQLPRIAYEHISRLSQALEEGEVAQLGTQGALDTEQAAIATSIFIDRQLADRIWRAAQRGIEIDQHFVMIGRVRALSDERSTFLIREREDGARRLFLFRPEHRQLLADAQLRSRNVIVRVAGTQHQDQDGALADIRVAKQIDIVGGPDVEPRLAELRTMQDGWLDGREGRPPARAVLCAAETLIWRLCTRLAADRPRIFPTPEGGVDLEWPRVVVTIEMSNGELTFRGTCIDFDERADLDETLDEDDIIDWCERALAREPQGHE